MKPLPDKPSELIRLALADLEECEKDPRYAIGMVRWHAPEDGRCVVCLAGAVMAKSLDAPIDQFVVPEDDQKALYALDEFRVGNILQALLYMGYPSSPIENYRFINRYGTDRDVFKSDMRTLAEDLEKAGL